MPKFVALIYGPEDVWVNQTPAEYEQNMAAHATFAAKHEAAIVRGAELQPTHAAKTVRNGSTVTDGPFIETKEALGGYYVLEAADIDAAAEIAKDIPEFAVELRPVVE